jgi:hypothetical protein
MLFTGISQISIEAHHPRLALPGTVLSGVSVFELPRRFMANEIKRIFITGNPDDALKALRVSSTDFLLKSLKQRN